MTVNLKIVAKVFSELRDLLQPNDHVLYFFDADLSNYMGKIRTAAGGYNIDNKYMQPNRVMFNVNSDNVITQAFEACCIDMYKNYSQYFDEGFTTQIKNVGEFVKYVNQMMRTEGLALLGIDKHMSAILDI